MIQRWRAVEGSFASSSPRVTVTAARHGEPLERVLATWHGNARRAGAAAGEAVRPPPRRRHAKRKRASSGRAAAADDDDDDGGVPCVDAVAVAVVGAPRCATCNQCVKRKRARHGYEYARTDRSQFRWDDNPVRGTNLTTSARRKRRGLVLSKVPRC